ncbi:MAG: BrnT family toxin [Roseiarcus sp.]|jgi:uncharacterized protein|uniref:BrnT family toxin n=1 Tax=Roseiarcus sp. TaxID=1969460 RepID=UPI003C4E1435
MRFEFGWDPAKAENNLAKHAVSFEEAMAVFNDPLALSRIDEDHGANEERWVTLGHGQEGRLALVVHTYIEIDEDRVAIRIISARRPTKREIRQYEDGTSE